MLMALPWISRLSSPPAPCGTNSRLGSYRTVGFLLIRAGRASMSCTNFKDTPHVCETWNHELRVALLTARNQQRPDIADNGTGLCGREGALELKRVAEKIVRADALWNWGSNAKGSRPTKILRRRSIAGWDVRRHNAEYLKIKKTLSILSA